MVSLRWQALPQQFAEDSVYCSGAKADDGITHATVVMFVGEVCAFAFRVSRVRMLFMASPQPQLDC